MISNCTYKTIRVFRVSMTYFFWTSVTLSWLRHNLVSQIACWEIHTPNQTVFQKFSGKFMNIRLLFQKI